MPQQKQIYHKSPLRTHTHTQARYISLYVGTFLSLCTFLNDLHFTKLNGAYASTHTRTNADTPLIPIHTSITSASIRNIANDAPEIKNNRNDTQLSENRSHTSDLEGSASSAK